MRQYRKPRYYQYSYYSKHIGSITGHYLYGLSVKERVDYVGSFTTLRLIEWPTMGSCQQLAKVGHT